jgi:hypothetical protein
MADKKITQLNNATALVGTEILVAVQNGETKQTTVNKIKNTLVPYNLTVEAGQTVNLSSSIFDQAMLIRLTWSGASGNMTLNLPSASDNINRAIRFISNGGFNTNTRVYLTPIGGDTLDGSTDYYQINKTYEGIKIWSDGSEWFIIQKKA